MTGVKCYLNFLAMHNNLKPGEPLAMPSESLLIYFVVHCSDNLHLAFTTIKSYLAGIRNFYIAAGMNHPLQQSNGSPFLRLQLVLKGIRKQQSKPSRPRLPITTFILRNIISILDQGIFGAYLDLLMKTACSMAFFGFMRCGEFTCTTRLFDPEANLSISDINITYSSNVPTMATILLKVSKTDPFRQGCTINLFCTNSRLCPVWLLDKLCAVRRRMQAEPQEPLFVLPDGQPLTRNVFLNMLKLILDRLGLDSSTYAGHSFRIGAATSAAAAHVPDHIIKILGRWSSDCYQRYIHTPLTLLEHASQSIATI